ncbi:HTH-type transcriptional regulator MalT [Halomonas koreensis]|uniref:HTH-type transcriptional regulator MalT n=1 Tax=Halomonas koreensis TaxID=245385 RepID=A0ABU1FXY8_9GAMM|nr:HTH-type transcriptional regulator MalT [Halomonas koreensis]MDR5865494.1 HTH-type transcriptional regulator MalT [Halomonas koreensis]
MTLIQDKLLPPPLPPITVARERLNAHFTLDDHVRLTLVQAPSGYGKSTLLAERLPALEQPAIWLRLEPQDDAPERFARYFAAALGRLCREHLGFSLVPDDPSASFVSRLEGWLTTLPEQAPPCRLVLDEFEHLRDPALIEGLRYWLRHQPRWLTLTVISRSHPDLGLAGLRLRGELEEIGVDALAFDLEESRTLCAEQLSFPPSRVSLERALRRTGGWAMALNWLVERTTTTASFDALMERLEGSHPDFVAWFDELMHEALDDAGRHLIRQLGVLERFSPHLAARLLEGEGARRCLEALEHAGLFIQRDDAHSPWRHFHPLFAQYLRYCRNELPRAEQYRLHRRASQAWLALGDPAMAVAQMIEGGDPEALAGLVEQEGPALLGGGQYTLLASALEALGDARLAATPRLTLLYGWVSHAQYQFARTERAIGWIEEQLTRPDWQPLAPEFAALRAQLAINQGHADLAAPLAEQALTQAAQYLDATPLTAAAILCESRFVQGQLDDSLHRVREVAREAREAGDDQRLLWAHCHESETLVAQGHLQAAHDVQERAFELMRERNLQALPIAEFAYRIRSQLLWEWQRLDEAEQAALDGIAVLDRQGEHWTLQCHVCLAKVALSRGDRAQCADHVRRIRKILAQGDYHIDWRANAHATLLTWWIGQGDRDAIAQWLREAPPAAPDSASNHFAQCNVRNHVRALMALDDTEAARDLLKRLERQTRRLGLVTDANRNRLCLARLAWQEGDGAEARQHLHQALSLAAHTTLVGSFLRLGEPLEALLDELLAGEAALSSLARQRACHLLELARRHHDRGRALRILVDDEAIAEIVSRPDVPELIRTSPLTRREWQILALIHAGLSNEQIAERLDVAPTTIKTHIRSLYQKQHIRRRDEAVALADRLLAHIHGEIAAPPPPAYA